MTEPESTQPGSGGDGAAEEQLIRRGLHDLAAGGADPAGTAVSTVLARGRRARRTRTVGAACAAALVVIGGSLLGLRLAGDTGADTAVRPTVTGSRTTTTAATPTPTSPLPARTLTPGRYESGPADPRPGVAYPYDLMIHCGLRYARFAGHSWETGQHVTPPPLTPDPRTGLVTETGLLTGYMTLVSADTIRFDLPGLTPVVFRLMDHDSPLCD